MTRSTNLTASLLSTTICALRAPIQRHHYNPAAGTDGIVRVDLVPRLSSAFRLGAILCCLVASGAAMLMGLYDLGTVGVVFWRRDE